MISKEDFCWDCPFIEFTLSNFYDPGYEDCPGNFDPDNLFCLRHKEWIEYVEMQEEI